MLRFVLSELFYVITLCELFVDIVAVDICVRIIVTL